MDERQRVSSYAFSPGDLRGAVGDTSIETRGACGNGSPAPKHLDAIALANRARIIRRV